MRAYLATAPAWLTAAIGGLIWVACMTFWNFVQSHGNFLHAFVSAVVGAAVFVPISWLGDRQQRARTARLLGGMTRAQQRNVLRAADKGAPPEDLALCPAALAMARDRLAEYLRWRIAVILVSSIFLCCLHSLLSTTGRSYFP